jgi:hypothetical protein
MHFPIRDLVSESQRALLFGGEGAVALSAGEGLESWREEREKVRCGRDDAVLVAEKWGGREMENGSRGFILAGLGRE